MLVSSIGYFDTSKSVKNENAVKIQSSSYKVHGFGHVPQKDIKIKNNDYVKGMIDACKSLFGINKADESSKYLSLIA